MKKLYIVILLLSNMLILETKGESIKDSTHFCSYIKILAEDSTVYIPTLSDLLYYNDPQTEAIRNNNFRPANIEKMKMIEAIYKLRDLPEDKIENLLFSSLPNLRIYGYIYYIRKKKDVYWDYLLKSFECTDLVYYVDPDQWVYSICHVSDVLLLIALRGVDYARILPRYRYYELTEEQKNILKAEYEKREPLDEYMDILIRHAFVSDEMY